MNGVVFAELSIRCEEIRLKAVQAVADRAGEISKTIEKQLGEIRPEAIEAMVREKVECAIRDAVHEQVRRQVAPAVREWIVRDVPCGEKIPGMVMRAVSEALERLR